jgi:hypothetical protein
MLMGLEVLFAAIYLVAAAVSLWSRAQVHGFLAETPSIRDATDLERFKELARLQMYLALSMIVLLVTGMIIGLVLLKRHGLPVLYVVILVNGVVFGLGMFHKKGEERARNLQTGSESLASEYRRVCEAWVKKATPDF